MPYDSNGVATVTRQLAVTGQTIEAVQVNVPFADIESMLSQLLLRSGVAGMTGNLNFNSFKGVNLSPGTASGNAVEYDQLQAVITSVALKLAILQPYVSVTSAATTNIGAAASQNILMSGSATITSFGTAAAGTVRNIVFSGTVTLTHNDVSLILPTGANIVTVPRDSLRAVSLGGGNWRVTEYIRAFVLDLYTGSSVGNTDFPIGERIIVFADGVTISRNGLIIPALSTSNSASYVRSVSPSAGALLAGTWRVRGGFGTGQSEWYEAVRTA